MMISRKEIFQALRSHALSASSLEGRPAIKPGVPTGGIRSDGVDLSERARDIKRFADLVADLPSVRLERTDPIARAVASGTYRVSEQDIAEKILGRSLVDDLK